MDTARKRTLMHRPASELQESTGSVSEVLDGSPLLRDRAASIEDESLLQARCEIRSTVRTSDQAVRRKRCTGQHQATRLLC